MKQLQYKFQEYMNFLPDSLKLATFYAIVLSSIAYAVGRWSC